MNSVEQAIRAALAKGNVNDPAFRQRIYGSASAALERSLTSRPFLEPEILSRRHGLAATIEHIEAEFVVASTPEYHLKNSTMVPPAKAAEPAVPVLETRPKPHKPVETPIIDRRGYDTEKRLGLAPSKRPFLKYALNAAFLLALIFGGFWIYEEGKRIYADATTPKNETPVLAETQNTMKDDGNWVEIFSARDTDLISVASGAKAEITSRDGVNYVVMSGDSANEVSVKIGSGLVQTFAGKRILFNIKARSLNGMTLDTGAHCDFGPQTKCERKRFKIGPQSTEYMFAVTLSASATGDGALLIAPDLTGGGGAVEIENIRATIVQPDAG